MDRASEIVTEVSLERRSPGASASLAYWTPRST